MEEGIKPTFSDYVNQQVIDKIEYSLKNNDIKPKVYISYVCSAFFANVILSSITLGLVISLVNIKTNKKEGYLPSFPITLIMLPVIISIIILLVGNNVARAFSLAGAFFFNSMWSNDSFIFN